MLENIKTILRFARTSLENVISTRVYLMDLKNFEEVNEVYVKHFP